MKITCLILIVFTVFLRGQYTPPGGGASVASVTVSTSSPVTVTTDGYYYCNTTACTYNLPAIASGSVSHQFCFINFAGQSGSIAVNTPSGNTMDLNGVSTASPASLVSGGALGDSACFTTTGTAQYKAWPNTGNWLAASNGIILTGVTCNYNFVQGVNATILYDITNGNNGTLQSTATYNSQGIIFNGTSDYVNVPSCPAGLETTVMSVALLHMAGSFPMILGKLSPLFDFRYAGSTRVPFADYGANSLTWTTALALDTWHMIGFTASASLGGSIVVDTGSPVTSATNNATSLTTFDVGRRQTDGNYFNGTQAYLLIYGRVLTAAQIQYSYQGLKALLAGRSISLP
jgi:hypothetical protein